jgi:hypothetical protein
MIAANYTTHLYCDCGECAQAYTQEQSEYIGESWSETARAARKDGWKISADRERCYAPSHKINRETK